MRNNMWWIWRW